MGGNIILAPLLIFGLAPVSGLGVAGAAIATVTAQLIVTLVLSMRRDAMLAFQMPIWQPTPLVNIKTMVRRNTEHALLWYLHGTHTFCHCLGRQAVAVQRVG